MSEVAMTEKIKPPFPRQQQNEPGATAKMDPQPDHGEESYKGSGRLKGTVRSTFGWKPSRILIANHTERWRS